jgi:hypothetical protein
VKSRTKLATKPLVAFELAVYEFVPAVSPSP